MSNFDRLLSSLPPNLAFQRAFNNPAQYVPAAIPAARRSEAKKEIAAAVADYDGWRLFGRSGLNKSSREAVARALHDEVAVLAQNSDVPTAKLVEQSLTFALRNGTLERYGAFAWRNNEKTEPLFRMLGLQEDEADEIVTSVIDQHLKAAGVSDGASGENYDVLRLRDEKGQPALYISALDDDAGAPVPVVIPFEVFQTEATRFVAGQVARVTPWKPNRVMQKVIDANAAEAAKVKPTQDILPVITDAAEAVVTAIPGYQMGRAVVNRVVSGVKKNNARRAARKNKK